MTRDRHRSTFLHVLIKGLFTGVSSNVWLHEKVSQPITKKTEWRGKLVCLVFGVGRVFRAAVQIKAPAERPGRASEGFRFRTQAQLRRRRHAQPSNPMAAMLMRTKLPGSGTETAATSEGIVPTRISSSN